MLRTSLESHPAIVCQSELFNTDNRKLPYPLEKPAREILDEWVYRAYPPEVQCVGFVLHAYHPWGLSLVPEIRQNPGWGDVWDILGGMDDLRVIRLVRRNLLRRHLSHIAARTTGNWHAWDAESVLKVTHLCGPPSPEQIGPPPGPPPALRIDPDRLEADFLDVVRTRRFADEALRRRETLVLHYEDICRDYDGACRRVQQFLGASPILDLRSAVEKLGQRSLAEAIANYEELKAHFAGTPWAEFFED
jgi:hypothetical protein